MQQETPSAAVPRRRWGRSRLVASTLALTVGVLGAGLAVTAIPAYADVVSSPYTIGSPSGGVGTVTATPASVAAGGSTTFSVVFTAAAALSGSSLSWITVAPSTALTTAPSSVTVIGGSCIQGGTSGAGGAGSSSTGGVTIYLLTTCSISAGTQVTVSFVAAAPPSTGTSFYFSVTTSSNTTPATSNTISVGTGLASLTASNLGLGGGAQYTITNVPVTNVTASQNTLVLAATVSSGSALSFYTGGAAGYTVSYIPSGGASTPDPVSSAVASGSTVTLTLANALASGYSLNIMATGVNPTTSSVNAITVSPGNGTPQNTNTITFGNSVSAVTATPASLVAGAVTSYTVSFKAASAVGVGGLIYLSETLVATNFASVTGISVHDNTAGWTFVATGSSLASGSATIPLSNAISAGDSLTITLANVTNPAAAQTVSDFKVSTSVDSVPVAASAYTIGANGSTGVIVTPSPNTAASIATYTISGLRASAGMSGGSSTIQLVAPSGTTWPATSSYYSITDSTTSSGSGTVVAGISGGGTNSVTFTVPNSINSGDQLTLTIQDVINPTTASSGYTISLVGNVNGPTAVAAFPHANVTYSNGAIVSYSGTHYVFAGGRAFGISTAAALTSLQKVDKAVVQTSVAGTTPPTSTTPRSGTLIFTGPVNGNWTIYVVGTDGQLHGFATPKQYLNDGYDPALVVTVPSLGGLTVGNTAGAGGAVDNALGTAADGAIVNDGGAYFTFAGGRAFGIGSPTILAKIRAAEQGPGRQGHRHVGAEVGLHRERCPAERARPGIRHLPGQALAVQVHEPAHGRRVRRHRGYPCSRDERAYRSHLRRDLVPWGPACSPRVKRRAAPRAALLSRSPRGPGPRACLFGSPDRPAQYFLRLGRELSHCCRPQDEGESDHGDAKNDDKDDRRDRRAPATGHRCKRINRPWVPTVLRRSAP